MPDEKPDRSRPRQPETGDRIPVSSYLEPVDFRRLELVAGKENRSKASVIATAIKQYLEAALGLTDK